MSLVDFLGLDEPSEYDLVRNHLQKVTHPHLTIRGHGDYRSWRHTPFRKVYSRMYAEI